MYTQIWDISLPYLSWRRLRLLLYTHTCRVGAVVKGKYKQIWKAVHISRDCYRLLLSSKFFPTYPFSLAHPLQPLGCQWDFQKMRKFRSITDNKNNGIYYLYSLISSIWKTYLRSWKTSPMTWGNLLLLLSTFPRNNICYVLDLWRWEKMDLFRWIWLVTAQQSMYLKVLVIGNLLKKLQTIFSSYIFTIW